jgi:O-antigen/teichoic acid export membrane protein
MNQTSEKSSSLLGKLAFGIGFKVISLLVGLLSMRWINTNLTSQDLKSLFLTLFFTSAILNISSLGLGNLVSRSYVTEKEKPQNFFKLWSNYFYIQVINFLIGGVVLLVIAQYNPLLPILPLMLIYLSQYFLAIDGSYKFITESNNRTWTFTITESISKILIIASLYFVVNNYFPSNKLISYSIVVIIFAVIQYLMDNWINRKEILWTTPNFAILWEHKKEIIQYTLLTTISVASANSDKWFLNFYRFSDEVINGYSNIYNLYIIGISVESFILPVLFYNMIKNFDINQKASVIIKNNKWFYLFFLETIIFSIGFNVGSRYLINFIDKDLKYSNYSFDVINILSATILFNSSIFIFSQFYLFKKKLKFETISYLISSIITIILYILLIPRYGHIGAAYATLLGTVINFAVKIIFVKKINT